MHLLPLIFSWLLCVFVPRSVAADSRDVRGARKKNPYIIYYMHAVIARSGDGAPDIPDSANWTHMDDERTLFMQLICSLCIYI